VTCPMSSPMPLDHAAPHYWPGDLDSPDLPLKLQSLWDWWDEIVTIGPSIGLLDSSSKVGLCESLNVFQDDSKIFVCVAVTGRVRQR
jgi:hypothetical protein